MEVVVDIPDFPRDESTSNDLRDTDEERWHKMTKKMAATVKIIPPITADKMMMSDGDSKRQRLLDVTQNYIALCILFLPTFLFESRLKCVFSIIRLHSAIVVAEIRID